MKIRISSAEILEINEVTVLKDPVYTVLSSGNTVKYKEMVTDVIAEPLMAESHEGMMVRFVDIIWGSNPDLPLDFGEWTFTSKSAFEGAVRADDLSEAIPVDYNTTFATEK